MKKRFDLCSRTNQLLLDGCCFSASFAAAYLLRFERWPAGADLQQLLLWLPILVAHVEDNYGISVFIDDGSIRELEFSTASRILRPRQTGTSSITAWNNLVQVEEILEISASRYPNKTAAVRSGQRLTCLETEPAANRLANEFIAHAVQLGDRVKYSRLKKNLSRAGSICDGGISSL